MKRLVNVAGHTDPLYVISLSSRCGDIVGGVAFAFGNEGGWVVPLEELRAIVREAEEHQRALAEGREP